jgi:tetratricopeptide (TPR) repeat protein
MAKMKSVFLGLVMAVFTMSAYSQNAGDFNAWFLPNNTLKIKTGEIKQTRFSSTTALDQDDVNRVLSYFDQQLQLTPDHAATDAKRGALYQRNGDLDKARVDIVEKVLQLDPNNNVAKKTMVNVERREALRRSRQANREQLQARNTEIETSLKSLQNDLSTLQPLKTLNAKQYTTFEEICRKFEETYFKFIKDQPTPSLFIDVLQDIEKNYNKLSDKQKSSLNTTSSTFVNTLFPLLKTSWGHVYKTR